MKYCNQTQYNILYIKLFYVVYSNNVIKKNNYNTIIL